MKRNGAGGVSNIGAGPLLKLNGRGGNRAVMSSDEQDPLGL